MIWTQDIQALGELSQQEPMAAHTTMAVGGMASWYFKPYDKHALGEALPLFPHDMPILPLGRGSNLLVSDLGFHGVVIDLGLIHNIHIDETKLTAEAGARMSKIAQSAANHGLSGLEFMATVPGDLGGGIAMNAGAFGQQVSDTCYEVNIIHRDGKEETLSSQQLHMTYRHTQLPSGSIVINASFTLTRDEQDAIRQRMRDMRQQRSQTQPLAMPNCGSVFKNPEGQHAAQLIEAAGLKGKRIGNAQISDTHANFIVNHGQASSQDVLALIQLVQQTVWKQFNIQLEPEVRILEAMQ